MVDVSDPNPTSSSSTGRAIDGLELIMIILVAILLPWLALLLRGHIFQALLCLVLQLTLLGWIPAALWAVVVVNNDAEERRHREMMRMMQRR